MPDEPHQFDRLAPLATPVDATASADSSRSSSMGSGAEVDEFAGIPTPRARRSPLVALSVIAVSTILLAHQVSEVRYALRSPVPLELGEARRLDEQRLADNTLVAVSGLPDYRNALLFEPKGDTYRRAFYRLLGPRSRLWVRAEETSTRGDLSDRVVGRLRRFAALPYAAEVREYYAKKVNVTRLVDLEELRQKLTAEGPPSSLHDRAGVPIDLAAADPARLGGGGVKVVVQDPEELAVRLSKDKFPVEEDARRELERLGAPIGPAVETDKFFVYPARVSLAGRSAYLGALEEQGYGFGLRRVELTVPAASLKPGPPTPSGEGTLMVPPMPGAQPLFDEQTDARGHRLVERRGAAGIVVPWSRVDSIQVTERVTIPEDAWVVIEGERPEDFRYNLLLGAVLLLFIGFNAWLLLRPARR